MRQHVRIVIAFQQQRTAALKMLEHMGRGMTQVSQDAEPGGAVSAGELKRLPRVVRYGERHDFNPAHINRSAVTRNAQAAFEVG